MKRYLIAIPLILIALLTSCEEEKVESFSAGREIYFEKFFMNEVFPGTASADSTVVSYFFYPENTKDIKASLVVDLSGLPLTSDLKFGLKVVAEKTTALPNEYTIDEFYTFRAKPVSVDMKEIKDTISIQLHRGDRLDGIPNGVSLVLELVPNELVSLGQMERVRTKIIIMTAAVRPSWWTNEVIDNLLGAYSDKKYYYFVNKIDMKAEMNELFIKNRPDEARRLALRFKTWLSEQDPLLYEDNGDLMEVTI